jgi:hypothetical protein
VNLKNKRKTVGVRTGWSPKDSHGADFCRRRGLPGELFLLGAGETLTATQVVEAGF